MAVKTFYLGSGQDGNFGALFDGVAQTAASRTDGWTVGKIASLLAADFDAATKQATGTFVTNTTRPSALITSATANAFKTPAALTGTFANTSWAFTFAVRAVTLSAQAGRMRLRVYRSVNANGSGATEITGSTQVGTTSSVLSTSADVTTVVTWSPGTTITLNNEFLFFAIAWEITTQGGSNSADVVLRTGSTGPAGSRIVTPDFVAVLIAAPTGLGSAQTFGAVATAKGPVNRTMTGLASPQTFGAVTIVATGPPQTVQVPGVYPPGAVYQASITGAVIVGDGHVVGGGWSYAAQFGTVTAKNVTLTPAGGVGSASAFGTVTVRTAIRPVAGGVPTAQAFGTVTPVVTGGGVQTAVVTGLGSAQSFGTLTVKGLITSQVTGVPAAQQFGVPTTRAVVTRAVGSVSTAQSFGTATVRAVITRAITGVNSAQSFGVPIAVFVVAPQTVPVNGVTSAQRFGPPGYRQIVPVQGLNPYITVTSIVGQVICGDGHLVGTFTYSPGQFGFVTIHTTVTRAVGGVGPAGAFGQVRPVNIQQPVAVQSAQSFGTVLAIPGPMFIPVLGIPSAQLFGHVTPHRYDLHVNCKPEGGFTMPPSTTGGFVLTPITEGGFVLNPVSDTGLTLIPRTEGDFVITAVDEDG